MITSALHIADIIEIIYRSQLRVNTSISTFSPLIFQFGNGIAVSLENTSCRKRRHMALPILPEHVERNILLIRGHRVILDTDLAILYGVPTKRLNEQVMRNKKRFPSDFMFQLTAEEVERLRSKIATLKPGRGQHRKYRPYGFTEQGVAMLSSVLHSERAIQVNIAIMRAFVQLREMNGSNKGLVRRLNEMEKKYDSRCRVVFEAIRELMAEPEPQVKRIGFKT